MEHKIKYNQKGKTEFDHDIIKSWMRANQNFVNIMNMIHNIIKSWMRANMSFVFYID